jgi:Leucine-rich repeat (LRR) protein
MYTVFQTAYLDVNINQLHGAIPTAPDNVKNCEVLYLADNHLTSNLPSSLFEISRLEVLVVEDNLLNVLQAFFQHRFKN